MDPNTPNLDLPQWQSTDDFKYAQVNGALMSIDGKVATSSFTSALRPTGTERFRGRRIYNTDTGYVERWNGTEWVVEDTYEVDINVPGVSNVNFVGKAHVRQIGGGFAMVTLNLRGTRVVSNLGIPGIGWTNLGTLLPVGLRPDATAHPNGVFFPASAANESATVANTSFSVNIKNDGGFQLRSAIAAATTLDQNSVLYVCNTYKASLT